MALSKIQAESMNLADTYDFTGTVTGAGGVNTPAFEAYLSSDQTVTDASTTKVEFDTEIFDTDDAYDNTTNYRFTPQVAGKYYIYANIGCDPASATSLLKARSFIYKNGSLVRRQNIDFNNSKIRFFGAPVYGVIDLNGSTDYIEIYGTVDTTSGTSKFSGTQQITFFGAYRIIE